VGLVGMIVGLVGMIVGMLVGLVGLSRCRFLLRCFAINHFTDVQQRQLGLYM
jgi:hypothetical protein